MKSFFVAGAAALLSIAACLPSAQAASVTLKSNGTVVIRNHRHLPPPPPPRFRRHHAPVCKMTTVRIYRNHRLIIHKSTVCR